MKYIYLTLGIVVCAVVAAYFLFKPHTAVAPQANTVPAAVEKKVTEQATSTILPVAPADPNKASVGIDPHARVFLVKGVNFAFDVTEIKVQKGETVTINFESTDGFHDFSVDGYNVKTAQVRPGTPTSVTFVADKVGTFEYYCSVGNHRMQGMVGKLIVEG